MVFWLRHPVEALRHTLAGAVQLIQRHVAHHLDSQLARHLCDHCFDTRSLHPDAFGPTSQLRQRIAQHHTQHFRAVAVLELAETKTAAGVVTS